MRSLSFVQRVCLDFTGSLFPHAICLGDADNDSLNELVVGDTSGKLYIYKNDDSKPWITRTCVGMLTCVGVGDICNKGKNLVVAVGAEGWFHLFDIAASTGKAESFSLMDMDEQKPYFTQHIPANTKVMLISDIDGDGRNELVVGYTDRVVRAFRWEEPQDNTDLSGGQLVLLKKWLLEGQVDSLSRVLQVLERMAQMLQLVKGPPETLFFTSPLAASITKNVSTHLIGSISRGSKDDDSKGGLFALCTLDGTLKLMDSSEQLLWSVQVDHQLFALQKLDVTGDRREEVVACAWDGQTYIIDHNRMVVRFQFDEKCECLLCRSVCMQGGQE
ncbi:hypothetical protein SRHO_G00089550 [Serrasalmus rhombeus]